MDKLSLGQKMVVLAVGIVVALLVIFANAQRTNSKIKIAQNQSIMRSEQLELMNEMDIHQFELLLAAMDSIVDKDDGKIHDERMQIIKETSEFIEAGLSKLEDYADTAEEKKLADEIKGHFPGLKKAIVVDLVKLIEESAIETEEIEESFMELDGAIDEAGSEITRDLSLIFDSLAQEAAEAEGVEIAQRVADFKVIGEMVRAQGVVSLMVMEALYYKDTGKISDEIERNLATNLGFLENNLGKLKSMVDTDEEIALSKIIAAKIPFLKGLIEVDLVEAVEVGAVKIKKIEGAFNDIDDNIDNYGTLVSEELAKYIKSVQEEATEEAEALAKAISNSSRINLIAFLVILGLVLPLIYFLARSIINPIENVIGGLNSSSDQVTSASGQVAQSSQSMAEGASEQASSLEEVSSSLEEMSSMTKQNADNAKQASVMSNDAKQAAEQGNATLLKMSNAIKEIKDSSDETAKIIKTIDEIAFQTNLLALNAAVEAARAGEAGKGFAVVAEEVRNLAQRSAEAAKNTSALIEGSQKNADNGVQVSNEVAEIFSTILTSTNKVTTLINEVAQASSEQAQGIEQVNTAVSNMDQVTQANAANAEESASASEELSAQAQEMKQMVNRLIGVIRGAKNQSGMQMSAKSFVAQDFHKPAYKKQAQVQRKKASTPPAKRSSGGAQKMIKPEEVIPLGDDDLNDF